MGVRMKKHPLLGAYSLGGISALQYRPTSIFQNNIFMILREISYKHQQTM
jgi:hypothetical protein